MNWGSDELHHRSAELSGWCAELRAADPEDVDETVPGAVEYAAGTTPHSSDAAPPETENPDPDPDSDSDTVDADDPADSADTESETADLPDAADKQADGDAPDDPDGYVCSLCGGDIPDGEALDAEGAPIDVGFVWLADVEAYHRSCIEKGAGRYLPWAANGILRDETTG